jgi:prevent-host-death family protein
MAEDITSTELRRRAGTIAARVQKERLVYIVRRRGKPVAALVPADWLEAFTATRVRSRKK